MTSKAADEPVERTERLERFAGSRISDTVHGADFDAVIDQVHAEQARAVVMSALFGEADASVRVGRFEIVELLGAGAFGRVYEAHDPQLDRRVALKLFRTARARSQIQDEQILQEAQAIAKLAHPNVVPVFEVGEDAGRPYLVMERIEGETLRKWLARRPRSRAEIVAIFEQCGRGLVAAHAAGIVHRDFKPDNVLVGHDGRARIVDFGLACAAPLPGTVEADDEATGGRGHGAGTPAYMALEQLLGQDADARSDQFAFCVSLWEALHGERPFHADAIETLAEDIRDGRMRPPRQAVPSWLQRACERGLSARRDQRWPSMDALLAVLSTGRARARRRTGLAVVGVLATLAIGIEGYRRYDVAQRVAACEASGDEVETAFDATRQEQLRAALVATGSSHAATTADKVMPWLERHAAAWREARVGACLDADVRGRWSEEMLDRSLWCLDERRMELQSLVDEMMRADAEALLRAVTAAAGLALVAPCRDERTLELLAPPPPERRQAVRPVRADLARAVMLQATGRYEEGLGLARDLLEQARDLDWPPLTAAVESRVGALLGASGAYDQAEVMLEVAYFDAAGAVDREVAYNTAEELAFVVGVRSARPDDGRRWGRLAEVEAMGLPDAAGLRRAGLLTVLASIDAVTGEPERALARHEEALTLFEQALGSEHPTVASSLVNLAKADDIAGAYDQARSRYERAIAILEQAYGPEHPDVATALVNLAGLHQGRGAHVEALASGERALSILERALGPEHPTIAVALHGLAGNHYALRAYDRAAELNERALAITEKAHGPRHPDVALVLNNLANVREATGERDEAEALYRRALAIFEAAWGPEHPDTVYPLLGLAGIALATERPDEAAAQAQRAVRLLEGHDAPVLLLATARFVLARALWDAPANDDADRLRARALAEQAREALRGDGEEGATELAEIERWLDEHVAPR